MMKLDKKDCFDQTQSLEVPDADYDRSTKYLMKLPIEGHADERAASQ